MRIQYSRNLRDNCITYRVLLDSGLVQLKEKNRIFLYSFTGKDYVKGGEDYVKDRKSESGHYVIPTGKVSEDPPPPLRQR